LSIQDLGSIGELLAAIVTIATLAYLARQIRGSNIVAESEASRAADRGTNTVGLAIAQDPDLAELFVRGLSDYSSLETVEKTRFQFLLTGILEGTMQVVLDAGHGLFTDQNVESARTTIRRFLSTSGGRAWLRVNADQVPQEFIRFVLETLEPSGVPPNGIGDEPTPRDEAQRGASSDST